MVKHSVWKCPNCGHDVDIRGMTQNVTSVFLGTVNESWCSWCGSEVLCMRGENGKYITLGAHVTLTEGVWPNVVRFLTRGRS